ncbi:hypothetical protein P872_18395 [Rhodonellum psychrophilum GCM71 = DSM 17998]|uniref:Uncharacterized protein n=2 Tax=Rhodonellum TaxID=336827 RepID=U5BWZ8_9BACT|nr:MULTISPECIES: hypothetical protein [Rhodonellum]ERM82368.1 hypothetical protein P872_18395 [Rhodonellum psychrophilum GCM71 = DSM 17998]SDZ35259.1 hypothetical protein SAMN05444412_11133 [Rhodonellum ikkaensis]
MEQVKEKITETIIENILKFDNIIFQKELIYNNLSNEEKLDNNNYCFIFSTRSKEEVNSIYEKIQELAYSTNFGGNPYENNSYMKFKYNGIKYHINSPKNSNGDKNWNSYHKDSKTIITIYYN